jgi:hypothetical protein
MNELRSRPLFDIRISLHPLQELGSTPNGRRRIAPVSGGSFEGERLKGMVLPHAGGDWVLIRPDDSLALDVRLTLKTDDEALIYMTYRGVRHGPAAVMARLARGERVDPAQYYFRTAPMFETASERYAWMNNIVSVGVGERLADGVRYRVFEIL